jgi:hypothetical protein
MKKFALLILIAFAGCNSPADSKLEESSIRELLLRQEVEWNKGNIDGFMEGYWKSDSLMFIGTNITRGWNDTMERYKRTYPDKETMGQLTFTYYDFKFIGNDACLVTGKYQLRRTKDDPAGMFTLLFKKIDGKWLIVYDHTS